ncbi:MAG: AMP-binding protein [Actinomycetota bacterium]
MNAPPWPAPLNEEEAARRYVAAGYWTEELIGDVIARHARARPEGQAVVDDRRRLSWSELHAQVGAAAAVFAEQGLGRGDHVVLQMPNRVEFVVAFLALARLGVVPVMALPGHRRYDLEYFCRHTDAAAIVWSADGDVDGEVPADELVASIPGLRSVAMGVDAGPPHVAWHLQTDADPERAPTQASRGDAGDVALLQLSGGSTGTPKLIPRTHADYLYSVRESADICGLTADSVYLCALPAAHNFAMTSPGILGALHAGAATVLCPDPSATTAFALIEREGVTITGVVPPIAFMWLAQVGRTDRDLSSLEVLQIGGAPLAPDVAARIEPEFGCRLQQVFGMAEGLVNYTRLDDDTHRVLGTQGRPISPDDEVLIVDDHDVPVPAGQPGHLLTRGPYTIRRYFRAERHNEVAFTPDGFYRTGDLVREGPDGYLTVVGRAKEQINRGGEKIAPVEIEGHLLTHDGVLEASVVGVDDRILGQRIVAHIVAADETQLDTETLLAHLDERGVARFKRPDRFVFADELPRTAVGKTRTTALSTEASGG